MIAFQELKIDLTNSSLIHIYELIIKFASLFFKTFQDQSQPHYSKAIKILLIEIQGSILNQ